MKKIKQYSILLFSMACFAACDNATSTKTFKTDSSTAKVTSLTKTYQTPIYTDTELAESFFNYAVPNDEYRYLMSERDRDINYFATNFKLQPNGNQSIVNPSFYLSLGAINKFIGILSQQFGYDKTKNFAGLKMMYGMTNSGMLLIFSPVVLTLDGNGNVECSVIESNQYYTTDANGGIVTLTTKQMTMDTQYYHSQVWINHPAITQDNHKFLYGTFPNADSKYTIIPIQQILAMYADNPTGNSHSINDKIQLNIGASNLFRNTGNPPNFKVHVIAGYNLNVECADDTHRFKDLAADFTQMCPPACNISYIPARLNQNSENSALRLIKKLFHKHTILNR